MNIWSWILEFQQRARAEGDVERAALLDDFQSALETKDTDPDRTLSLLEQSRAKAKVLDEPKWMLFFDHWILQTQLFFRRDYRNLLDHAVKASMEACKSVHRDLPQRVCIHEDLIHAYVGIDPVGYADRIAKALDFMKGEAHPHAECQHCILGCRASFESEMGRFDASREIGEEKLRKALDEGSDHHSANAYSHLADLAVKRQDWEAALELAKQMESRAQRSDRDAVQSQALVYQALALRKLGREEEALVRYGRAVARIKRLAIPSNEIYATIAHFYESAGDDAKALRFREKQFKVHGNRGRLLHDFRNLKERCRLLARLGRLQESDVAEARAAAAKLRHAEKYLAELDEALSNPNPQAQGRA
ncbi:MAG: hypothetical protein K2X38_07530 [Gemmataceae bacterium]|nr:hypothetical protein [Gemmataceae bacterium]